MNIPADAVIATDKLTGYLLIARPLDDKSKFLATAGFTQSNSEILEAAIRNLATAALAEEVSGLTTLLRQNLENAPPSPETGAQA